MNTISFMGANYVTRECGYRMPEEGWGQAHRRTSERFAPLATFAERFGELAAEVAGHGFTAMDVWMAHLDPPWATDEHIAIATGLLREHGLTVPSLAGSVGATIEDFARVCRVAAGLGAPVVGGMAPVLAADRAGVLALLEEHDLVLGVENHPERTPEEYLAVLGDPHPRIGAALDTGWFGTHGFDAAEAIEAVADRLVHVHLKDVKAPGGHETVGFGQGCVPIRACVEALGRIGYGGAISIEHEPELGDPVPDVLASRELLTQWMDGRI
ncbi:sugar phosphate isomerase/epimerase family protein [Thermoactinospora rubra]|uniref:sugar phosphate isomerase/epimerase family protein n=1 Tax=Thermoactinospora rubra TaxID=1088767 RepID=UPI000A0FF380|nr:sugar phosphate isomerase/epimerase family protein [Thermoactinospora rubra]